MYVVGIVLKPQGIKGELRIKSVSPNPERFKTLKKIFIKKETIQTYSIQSVRISERFVFLKLAEINSRDEAEYFRGCEILIEESDLLELNDHEYFFHDLIGCGVYSEDGLYLGELILISQGGSNDIYTIKNESGKEILIPAISEVIKQVDLDKKEIKIHLLEGLID